MKFALTLSSLLVGASLVSAAAMPEPTQAPELDKRQIPGLDLSAILADPSSALGQISSLIQGNPTFASIFASVTADPAFQSSISAEIVSAVGTESASAALAQYSSALAGFATATSGAASSSVASSSSAAATAPTTSASSGSGSNGAQSFVGPSSFVVTLVGTAASLGAAIVLLA